MSLLVNVSTQYNGKNFFSGQLHLFRDPTAYVNS